MKTVPEIIAFITDPSNKPLDKFTLLKSNDCESLRCIVQIILNNVKFNIKQIPKYKPDNGPIGYSMSTLMHKGKDLYIFLPETTKTLGQKRTDELLVQFLESIHETEAKFVESLLLGTHNITIDRELVKYALPEFSGV